MTESKYILLIHKELNDIISDQEKQVLSDWLNQSAENRQLKEEIELTWQMSSQYKQQYTPNVELGLSLLKEKIKAETRQEQAKVVTMKAQPKSRRAWLGIAASIAFLVVAGLLWNTFMSSSTEMLSVVASNEKQELSLPDGTKVWVNKGSELKYPSKFDGSNRIVYLTGEAFFDVKRNPNKPFIIETVHTTVAVLGTSFNVKAYNGENTTTVNVKSGKVQFQPKDSDKKLILTANEKATFDNHKNTLVKGLDKTLNSIAWQSDQLTFRKSKLSEVIADIESYYKVKIDLTNTDLINCEYTSLFNKKDLKSVLNSLSGSFKMQIEQENTTTYKLIGGSCN